MQQNHTEILLQQTISPQLSVNLSKIRTIAEGSSDLLVNEFVLSGLPAALLCCEGMLSTSTMTELILKPITAIRLECPTAANVFAFIRNHQLLSVSTVQRQAPMLTCSGF